MALYVAKTQISARKNSYFNIFGLVRLSLWYLYEECFVDRTAADDMISDGA